MIWLIVALSLPVVAVLAVAAIGSLLPKEFAGRAEAVFPRPPEAVFAAIADFERHPMSSTLARKVERLAGEGARPAWRESLGSSTVEVRTVAEEPPRRVVRDLRDSVVPMAARWSIELAPEGAAARTRVTVVQTGTVERGTAHVPFFRFILHVLGGARKGPEAYLAFLAKDLGPAPADAPGLTGSAAAPPPPTSRSPPA